MIILYSFYELFHRKLATGICSSLIKLYVLVVDYALAAAKRFETSAQLTMSQSDAT